MKGLYKRKDTWWVRFSWEGKQRFVTTGEKHEGRAIIRAEEIKADPASFLDTEKNLDPLIDRYLAEKEIMGVSKTWRENEEWTLKQFVEDQDIASPRRITKLKIENFILPKIEQNQKTGLDYLYRISRFCDWLVEKKKISDNPCQKIPRPKKQQRPRKRFLTVEEGRRLLDTCEDPDLKMALYLGLHAGLRKGEVLAARPDWVDLENGLLHIQAYEKGDGDVWTTKGRKDRTVPLTKEFVDFIRERLEEIGKDAPFLAWPEKTQGTWRNRKEFRKPYAALLEKCEITDTTFHDLRRTFASLHVSAGTSIYKVAKWIGDGVAVVEKHYGHLTPKDDEIENVW